MKCPLLDGGDVLTVDCDRHPHKLTARIDRSKPALGRMPLQLHMYRCAANIAECRTYYEALSRMDGEYLGWREIVLARRPPPLLYVQANTFLHEGTVALKECERTVEGIP